MADNSRKAKQGGLSRGKLILIGVLALVLVGVLYWQFGGSANTDTTTRTTRRRPAAVPAPEANAAAGTADKKAPTDGGGQNAVAAIVDESQWKSPNLPDVVDYDPFALPATFPKPRVAEPTGENSDQVMAQVAKDDAKKLADAIQDVQNRLTELQLRGVQVIVREHNRYVAMIGDKTYHVGDDLEGFTVTAIDQGGVHIEMKPATE